MEYTTVTLWVEDPEQVSRWYQDHLGLRILEKTPRFALVGGDGPAAVGFHVGAPLGPYDGVQLHFQVDDVDAAYQSLLARGLVFDEAPTARPWGVRSASLRDPAGISVELVTPRQRA